MEGAWLTPCVPWAGELSEITLPWTGKLREGGRFPRLTPWVLRAWGVGSGLPVDGAAGLTSGMLCRRLESWQYEEWGSQVTVVSRDMREWAAPEQADVVVSELLGSFADNELSPECLDGAQHCLKGAGRQGGDEVGQSSALGVGEPTAEAWVS